MRRREAVSLPILKCDVHCAISYGGSVCCSTGRWWVVVRSVQQRDLRRGAFWWWIRCRVKYQTSLPYFVEQFDVCVIMDFQGSGNVYRDAVVVLMFQCCPGPCAGLFAWQPTANCGASYQPRQSHEAYVTDHFDETGPRHLPALRIYFLLRLLPSIVNFFLRLLRITQIEPCRRHYHVSEN